MLYVSKLSSFNKAEYCRTKVVVLAEDEKETLRTDFSGLGRKSYLAHDKLTTQVSHILMVWYAGKGSQLCEIKTRNLGTPH